MGQKREQWAKDRTEKVHHPVCVLPLATETMRVCLQTVRLVLTYRHHLL